MVAPQSEHPAPHASSLSTFSIQISNREECPHKSHLEQTYCKDTRSPRDQPDPDMRPLMLGPMAAHDDYAGPSRDAEGFWEQGDYASALDCYTTAMLVFRMTYPGRVADPTLLELKIGAARCLEKLDHLEECVELDSEVLNEREKILEPTDKDLLILRETLAANNTELGKHEAALSLLHTNLEILESPDYGPEHEWTLQTKYGLAMEMSSVGEYHQALLLLEETLYMMTAKQFPHEDQEMIRARISMVQESMVKRALDDHAILPKKDSSAPKLKPPIASKHQETKIKKKKTVVKDELATKTSKTAPPAAPVPTKVKGSQELVNHKASRLPSQ